MDLDLAWSEEGEKCVDRVECVVLGKIAHEDFGEDSAKTAVIDVTLAVLESPDSQVVGREVGGQISVATTAE